MAKSKNDATRDELMDQLIALVRELPQERIMEVSDFVRDLRANDTLHKPVHGSAEALLQALDRTGPLQFEPDELDTLLADIERMRELDMEEHG